MEIQIGSHLILHIIAQGTKAVGTFLLTAVGQKPRSFTNPL